MEPSSIHRTRGDRSVLFRYHWELVKVAVSQLCVLPVLCMHVSTTTQPLTFAPNQVIKGWTEAMQLMKEGGKWELYMPSELGYGDRGAGGSIPGGAVLVFTLELLEVKGNFVQ